MNFIYVMKKDLRDKLVKCGYTLLKEDESNSLWVFANSSELHFEFEENCPHMVYSDVLSF